MRVTVINGSPHKGNTFQLYKYLEKLLSKYPDITYSYIHLSNFNLKPCIGCFNCIRNGHDRCPLNDDRNILLEEMHSSDGIVLLSPAYNFNISSLMKNFIDRFAFIGHRPDFFKQHLLILSSTAATGLSQVKKYLINSVGNIWGFRSVQFYGIDILPSRKIINVLNKNEHRLTNLSNKFYQRMKTISWKPKYAHIDQFCTMKMIWTLDFMKESFPYDYEYYNSIKNNMFYFPVKVNKLFYYFSFLKSRLLKIAITLNYMDLQKSNVI